MNSIILRVVAKALYPLLLVFSIFLLLRGHNAPGGGFVGGLIAAGALSLYTLAYDPKSARGALWIDPHILIGLGLLVIFLSGLPGLIQGNAFLTGVWSEWLKSAEGKSTLGTVVLFDCGVYLGVIGVTLLIIFSFAED